MIVAEIFLWFSILVLVYVVCGYPLLLLAAASLVRRREIVRDSEEPSVTLLISAYNEEKVIAEKIVNSLSLDYPTGQFEIIVVSDGSTDSTDTIVNSYASERVTLKRMSVRKGKTAALNKVVPIAHGDILVFSDANTLYAPDAIRKLVRNFADPTVGCVTGDSRYVNVKANDVGKNENAYWGYERFLKTKESQIGSLVGSDGAMFAIRTHLYTPLRNEDINDFLTPLHIVGEGYRCIFEPEAICYESATVSFSQEFRRKVRVVNRGWNGLFHMKQLLNPFRYGRFSIQLISHKLLRWLTPFLLAVILVLSIFIYAKSGTYLWMVIGQLIFYSLGGIGIFMHACKMRSRLLSFPCYFVVINAASAVGIVRGLLGQKIDMWKPERAGQDSFSLKHADEEEGRNDRSRKHK